MSQSSIALSIALAFIVAGCNTSTQKSGGMGSSTTTSSSGMSTTSAGATAGKVHKLASGLQYEDLVVGSGKMAETGMNVSVHYTGWLTDGTQFDSSANSGSPLKFQLGAGQVIAGWEEGVKGMRIGGKRKLTIPPDLAYGARGSSGVIPPNATLLFDIELIDVQ